MSAATVEAQTPLAVGDGIQTYEQFLQLPVGTKIGPRADSAWVKIDHSSWLNPRDDTACHYTQLSVRGTNKVQALPTTARLMTLKQWQWRWLDHVWWSAEQAGVGHSVITTAQEQMDLPDSMFPIGPGVKMKSYHSQARIPVGALVYQGNPDDLTLGLFRQTNGNWVHVLGDNTYFRGHQALTMASVPDGTDDDWATANGTPEDQELISQFKARAWRTGWKAKVAHRWCETYESYMAQIGLTADVMRETSHNGLSVGDRVDPATAAALPERSVLRWRKSDGSDWAWFVRDNDNPNRAGTQRLFGSLSNEASHRNYATSMEVLWIHEDEAEQWAIPATVEEVAALPPGSRIDIGGTIYRIAWDRRVTYDNTTIAAVGTWDATQFGLTHFQVVSVG